MPAYRFVVQNNSTNPRSASLLDDAHALGFTGLLCIECQDLYFMEGQLSPEECKQLALNLLIDPVIQTAEWGELTAEELKLDPDLMVIEVALRHGVTDPVADEILRASQELGIHQVKRASTGTRYLLYGVNENTARQLAERLLANAVIQRWTVGSVEPSFPTEAVSSGEVERIHVLCGDDELLAISRERRASLDLKEMQAIRAYCEVDGRDLTDVEFECIAQTWSEHCVHKTFKGRIEISNPNEDYPPIVNNIFRTFIQGATTQIAAPWVRSAFADNAGIIDLDDEYEVSFKVETHNHPSAIEPFGGANTGVGGVIRDVLGVSHKPIANTDVLCFGLQDVAFKELPAGVLHPRRILSGVVAGVQDYGNKMGIPTVNGAILFDPGYAANPLVFCGTVGISPKGMHVRTPQAGDRVIVLGGRTGRDGLRGATFSSMTMDAQTGQVSGSSVQIGNPIVEKGLVDVILPARDLRLYTAITDCGAGGLSSAVGEMSSGSGCDVDLTVVRLKYPGLAPWEIWLSEAQERMVLAVPPRNLAKIKELCDTYNVELTDIGVFTKTGRLIVRYKGKIVVDLANTFLHGGIPQRELKAVISDQSSEKNRISMAGEADKQRSGFSHNEMLLKLLAHPNISSKAGVIRSYDHEVQGGTVVKPLTGTGMDAPSDACVLKPPGVKGKVGIAIANGINPEYGKRDARRMAMAVMDEAVRNLVAVGVDPGRIAVLDNFCWGDPLREEMLGFLVEAARGCHDAALLFKTPFISGKDSLNNEYLGTDGQRHAIPPTLLISSIGIVPDVNKSVTMDLKTTGNVLYLVGEYAPVFGGSHFNLVCDRPFVESVPAVAQITPAVYRALYQCISGGYVRSAHDLSEGGIAVTAAEMCIGGRLGMEIELQGDEPERTLFGETTGCLLVEVHPEDIAKFESGFIHLPIMKIGRVTSGDVLKISCKGEIILTLPILSLITAWNTPLQPAA